MTEKGEIRPKERAPFFVCCIVCRFSPFLCHLTLPSSHLLTASALSLSSSLLWFCPPLDPYLLSLFWQASTQIWLPILFSVFCHSLALPLHPQALSRSLVSLYWTSLSFLPLSKCPRHSCVSSVGSDSPAYTSPHASVNNMCTNLNKNEGMQ